MATVTFRGNPIELAGRFPAQGEKAPALKLTTADLSEATLDNFAGKAKVLNIFPSIDTPTCAASVRKFNEKAAGREGTVVLCISADLPFAQKRFCSAENLNNVLTLSTFRNPTFLEAYGVKLSSGPLRGLATRAVLVLDANNNILHSQLVSEIGFEPNYDSALSVL